MNEFDEIALRDKMEPFVRTFLKGVESVKDKTVEIQKDAQKELATLKKQNQFLKDQTDEFELSFKTRQIELGKKIESAKQLQLDLSAEIDRQEILYRDVKTMKRKSENNLKATEGERVLAEEGRRKLDEAIKTYKDKTIFLKDDFALLTKRSRDLDDQERKNKIKDKDLLKRDELLIEKDSQLSIREIELKKKKEQVEIEIKRSHVNV